MYCAVSCQRTRYLILRQPQCNCSGLDRRVFRAVGNTYHGLSAYHLAEPAIRVMCQPVGRLTVFLLSSLPTFLRPFRHRLEWGSTFFHRLVVLRSLVCQFMRPTFKPQFTVFFIIHPFQSIIDAASLTGIAYLSSCQMVFSGSINHPVEIPTHRTVGINGHYRPKSFVFLFHSRRSRARTCDTHNPCVTSCMRGCYYCARIHSHPPVPYTGVLTNYTIPRFSKMAAGCATNLCALHDGRITHLHVIRCFFPVN